MLCMLWRGDTAWGPFPLPSRWLGSPCAPKIWLPHLERFKGCSWLWCLGSWGWWELGGSELGCKVAGGGAAVPWLPPSLSGLWGAWCLPGEEMLHVWGWAETLPVWELWGSVRPQGEVRGRSTRAERGKMKERKGGSLSVAREENVKDGQLAGSVHHLGGERAGRGKVGLWFICPSPVG